MLIATLVLTLAGAVGTVQAAIGPDSVLAPEPLWLLGGDLAGALARAKFVRHQQVRSAETGLDIVFAAVIGLCWNLPLLGLWPPFDFPERASYVQRAAIVGLVVVVGLEVFKKILMTYAPAYFDRLGSRVAPPPSESKEPKP